MKELKFEEVADVNGGLLPIIAYGVYFGSGAVITFTASFGFAAGFVESKQE